MATWMLPSELALPTRDRRGPCSSTGVVSQKGEAGRQTEGEADTFPLSPLPSPPSFPLPIVPLSPPPHPQAVPASHPAE